MSARPETMRRSASDLVYRTLLLAFPRSFRREFGGDMLQLFRDKRQETPFLQLWARTLKDILTYAFLERVQHWRARRSAAPGFSRHVAPDEPFEQKGLRKMFDQLRQDLGFAIRTFARNPGFTAIALITLALGIGANTAIFSVMNGVLFRPLQFGEPEKLVAVWEYNPDQEAESGDASAGVFQDWRTRNQTFEDLTAWGWDTYVMQGDDESVSVNGVLVYPNFFSVMQMRPLFGRAFADDDADPGRRGTVVLISHRLWQTRWGADPSVVGQTVTLDGNPVTSVGVMRPNVAAPHAEAALWQPYGFRSNIRWDRHGRWINVYGRLNTGATVQQAQQDLSRVHTLLAQGEFADIYEGWDARVVPLREEVVGEIRATLVIAFGAVGLVLLIACVNIANMLLARAAVREREMAVRSALGAGRRRITRQLLTESLLLALGGGVLGLGFGYFTHNLILSLQPDIIPRAEELTIDWTALGFAAGASLLTGILFGLAPAFYSGRVDVSQSLSQGGTRSVTAGKQQGRTRAILVTSQLALTMVLLCGAGLLIRSMVELRNVNPGFDTQNTVAARFFLDGQRYNSEEKIRQYYSLLARNLKSLPGIDEVGASSALPMDPIGINYDLPYRIEGQEHLADNELPSADFRVVSPGYFEAMRIPVRSGRSFSDADGPDATFVALINETMSNEVWPNLDPVGERFDTPSTDWHNFEIVGVVGDTRYYGLGSEPRPEMYVALAQVPRTGMTVVARTAGDPADFTQLIRREVLRQDPAQPTHSIVTVPSLVAENIASERFYALVLGIFALVALVLSAAGIYGVLSYWVNQRNHEIGVRMALGASRSKVLQLVVGQGMALVGAGVVIGLAGAFASTRVLSNVLFQVGAADPLTFAGVTFALGGVALLACWIPAFRASRVDPVNALRD